MTARERTLAKGLRRSTVTALAWTSCFLTTQAQPAFRPWGYDLTTIDERVRPGDDFFRYSSGAWLDRTEIPADKRSYSVTMQIIDATDQHVRSLLEAADAADPAHAPKSQRGKVGAFYRSYMDSRRAEDLGVRPLVQGLDRIKRAETLGDIAALMGEANVDFQGSVFRTSIDTDQGDPSKFAVQLDQPVLGLPDKGYYVDDNLAPIRSKYRSYIIKLLGLARWRNPSASADRILDFETQIAKVNWSAARQRDLTAAYSPMSVAELSKAAPGFAWRRYLASEGLSHSGRIVLRQKSAIIAIADLVSKTPVQTLKAWLAFTTMHDAAPYLNAAAVDAFFALHDQALGGSPAPPPRWRRAVRAVSGGDFAVGDRYDRFGTMGWAVGELYVAKYMRPDAKTKIETMVANIRAAYRARVAAVDWLTPSTKSEALRKLDAYRVKVGYPTTKRDYSSLVIFDDDLTGNIRRAAANDWAAARSKLGVRASGEDWIMTPQTVDAYHGLWRHEIVFPAAILQAPIFDPDADPAVNYGAIGATIGHEITHGLDDQGRAVDADGRLNDWWTPRDAEIFKEKSGRLAAQFSLYEALPGVHVDGRLVLGEALADLLGLSVALDAYHASLKAPAPVLDGLTGDQRFFLGDAQYFRGKVRPEATRTFLFSDPHPPRALRVNGVVRNVDGWYPAYGVKEGDQLFLAPADRVRLW